MAQAAPPDVLEVWQAPFLGQLGTAQGSLKRLPPSPSPLSRTPEPLVIRTWLGNRFISWSL